MLTNEYIFTVFITILTVVDPLGIIPVYLPLVRDLPKDKQQKLVIRSVLVATAISFIFLILGRMILNYLQIEYYSLFAVGGVILFKIGLSMIYGQTTKDGTIATAANIHEISVFPIAVPMLSGPGLIATIIMFVMKDHSIANYLLVTAALIISFVLAGIVMRFSGHIHKLLGQTGINIMDRIMGILLCALAVQFLANSFKTFWDTLS